MRTCTNTPARRTTSTLARKRRTRRCSTPSTAPNLSTMQRAPSLSRPRCTVPTLGRQVAAACSQILTGCYIFVGQLTVVLWCCRCVLFTLEWSSYRQGDLRCAKSLLRSGAKPHCWGMVMLGNVHIKYPCTDIRRGRYVHPEQDGATDHVMHWFQVGQGPALWFAFVRPALVVPCDYERSLFCWRASGPS